MTYRFYKQTARLILREMRPDDAPALFLLNEDPEVLRYTGDVPFASAPGGGPVAVEDAAPIAALGSEAWPNYGQPYPDETLIKDGRWYVRTNKIVGLLVQLARAVAQLQWLAKARGDLR